jgi:hypothetical protein
MVFLFFRTPYASELATVSGKTKTPFGGFVLCLISGAGGSRTRVQARRPYAFYMLIPA